MEPEIPMWEHTLEKWYSIAQRNINVTSGLIKDIKSGSAKMAFTYNWVLIGQSWLGNTSITQYLAPEIIIECKRLYDDFERLRERYNPINPENDILPPRKQDEIARKMHDDMFDDPRLLAIYNDKLDLEKKIFTQLEKKNQQTSLS